MSQPFDRNCCVPAPGKVDSKLKEFWVENPWDIVAKGHNLSAFERNRVYLNVRGENFLEISHLTGADSDGDGKAVAAGDFRNTGQLDLAVRQSGGGPFLLFENNFPRRHYLKVTLRGKPEPGRVPTSNRQGVGVRLTAETGGRKVPREMFPMNTGHSQQPNIAHFGLGDATKVERLTIRWPSGREQVLTNVPADQHILVEEGNASFETIIPGQAIRP